MELKLKGKRAFISGSTQGIGLAIAQQLLREGASVVINGRQPEKTQQVKRQLESSFPGADIGVQFADFTKMDDVERLLSNLSDIDILINNVGVFELKEFKDITDDDWYTFFEINVMSAIRLSRHLLPHMLAKKWGRILFISSESGVNVPEQMIHYGMTKAAMSAVANGLSKLTKGTQVTVNTILGGPTYSDGVATAIEQNATNQNLDVELMKKMALQQENAHILLQRFISPDEIAHLATYLSSPLSVATNGAAVRADSGVLKTI